jgi:beta-mannosidase
MNTKRSISGEWSLRIIGDNVFGIKNEPLKASVPGTVYGTLLDLGLMPDPFYRDNELKCLKLMENDFEYETDFSLSDDELSSDECILRLHGVDTLGDIYVNDTLLGSVCNMHKSYDFSLKSCGKEGLNSLKIVLHSPTKYIKEENEKCYTGGSHECMEGFPHLRKAHCMFGWDWGPRLPDAGIYRDVEIVAINKAELESVYITQIHDEGRVYLEFEAQIAEYSNEAAASDYEAEVVVTVTAPDGTVFSQEEDGGIIIDNPLLWYPRGYGNQPLYTVKAVLYVDGDAKNVWTRRIGLRTMTVNQEANEWGETFAHEVNRIKVFAMGADYVPEDNLFGRINEARTRRLLEDAALAGHNTIRVWGGGYYPDDYFYDICDELGILVWQDFMFACANYELDDEFEENITEEISEVIVRLRHHACLALWSGNNEMETQTLDGAWKPSIKQKYDYIKIFEYIIPKLVKEFDPGAFYWPSSPSAGGNYDNPWNPAKGDTHYWDVWHGERPFTDYRKHMFSYVSEFGFQSFPSEKTIDTFALPADKNIFSRIMEMHQRNPAANGKIMKYLGDTYLYPESFSKLLYLSQLLQAEGIRMGVEHFRRNRGKCMGTVVWQLNDIWPVASWASIDYYGRWKALHSMEKKIFEPIHISCEDIGECMARPYCILEPKTVEFSGRLHVANETSKPVKGKVVASLRNASGEKVSEDAVTELTVPAYDGIWLEKMEIPEAAIFDNYLYYEFYVDGKVVSYGSTIFTQPKHFNFINPEITVEKKDGSIFVTAKSYAKNVIIEGIDGDCLFEENCFDMNPGTKEIKILRGDSKEFKVFSVYGS